MTAALVATAIPVFTALAMLGHGWARNILTFGMTVVAVLSIMAANRPTTRIPNVGYVQYKWPLHMYVWPHVLWMAAVGFWWAGAMMVVMWLSLLSAFNAHNETVRKMESAVNN